MSDYNYVPATDMQDTGMTNEVARRDVGKPTINSFSNNLNFWTQSLAPVAYETVRLNGNQDAALVLSTSVNGYDAGVQNLNAQYNPYGYGYSGSGGMPQPYSPYLSYSTATPSSNGIASPYPYGSATASGTSSNMTAGSANTGTATGTSSRMTGYPMASGTSANYSTGTSGASTDQLMGMTQEMAVTQMNMIAMQAQINESALQANLVSNTIATKYSALMSIARNAKLQ